MSLPSEKQSSDILSKLVKANTAALDTMERTPYQPIVYAIPEEQRLAELSLLREAVSFQPNLYQQIGNLATWEHISKRLQELQEMQLRYLQQTAGEMTGENHRAVRVMQESILQAGKKQEQLISDFAQEGRAQQTAMNGVISRMEKKLLRIVIITSVAAVLFSVLVCVVFWKLVKS